MRDAPGEGFRCSSQWLGHLGWFYAIATSAFPGIEFIPDPIKPWVANARDSKSSIWVACEAID